MDPRVEGESLEVLRIRFRDLRGEGCPAVSWTAAVSGAERERLTSLTPRPRVVPPLSSGAKKPRRPVILEAMAYSR